MGIDKEKHAFVAHGLRPLNLKDTLQREAVLATFNWVPWAADSGSSIVVLKTLTLLLEDIPQFVITIVFLSQTGSALASTTAPAPNAVSPLPSYDAPRCRPDTRVGAAVCDVLSAAVDAISIATLVGSLGPGPSGGVTSTKTTVYRCI